jgi:protein tyrosine/serine phosphatase
MSWISLDGAVNVRDVGGLPTVNGAVTAPGRLLRADNLQDLSDADIARLVREFGLTRVVDLRTTAERVAEGPSPLAALGSVEHVHHSMILQDHDRPGDDDEQVVSEVLLARQERFAGAEPDDVVSGVYHGYLEDRPDSVVGALRAIADSPGAAIVHCAAGKDRTGVVVALALLAVGVRRDAVIADYVATADRIDAILARLGASPTYADSIARITPAEHTPRAAAMERFLSRVEAEPGGVLGWLAGAGFGPDDVTRLRAKLLDAG